MVQRPSEKFQNYSVATKMRLVLYSYKDDVDYCSFFHSFSEFCNTSAFILHKDIREGSSVREII